MASIDLPLHMQTHGTARTCSVIMWQLIKEGLVLFAVFCVIIALHVSVLSFKRGICKAEGLMCS